MAFRVRFSDEAQEDVAELTAYIVGQSGAQAGDRWLVGLVALTNSLSEMPERFALAPESDLTEQGVRQTIYHSHRILYEVVGEEVRILRVYHSRRDRLRPEDLP